MVQVARGVLQCFIFIQDLLCSFITPNKDVDLLPDDILIDILSRLPAHCVQQCRKVCRHWRALTSTRRFAEMQFKKAPSMIFVQCEHLADGEDPFHMVVFDERTKSFEKINWKPEVVATISNFTPRLISSYCGLFVCKPSFFKYSGCVVFDPFTELVKWIPFPFYRGNVCGIFFQPLANEYKILMYSYHPTDYYIYGSKSSQWRNISSGSFTFRPQIPSPVIVNDALHWIVDPIDVYEEGLDLCKHAVIVFDIESEKFRTLPHPNINHYHVSVDHRMLYLFEKDESLYLCNMLEIFVGRIEMWLLKDYESWIWVKSCKLDVQMLPQLYMQDIMNEYNNRLYKNISIKTINEDELLIDWFSYGLYILNLSRMTLIELPDPCYIRNRYGRKTDITRMVFTSHKSRMHPSAC